MTYFNNEYQILGVLLVLSLIIPSLILFLSFVLASQNPDTEKLSAYECGFDAYEDARHIFDIKFYLIAILFIVFDIEALYIFPWTLIVSHSKAISLWIMLEFLSELIVGYYYAWSMGALEW